MHNAILSAHNLSKSYGDFKAVDQVSFDIRENEIFSLLGPNGAGKTTTISMLATLIPPTEGTATIEGNDILQFPLKSRQSIGIIPQDLALYEDLTGIENLNFWGTMYNLRGKELRSRSADVLERIGLTDKAQQKVKTYSGGMKRRLNIGVGLLHRPKILFMDEPTVGIDPQSRRKILDMVKEFNQDGMSVLYTTHYMEEAQELSHRVGIIDHGKMIAIGTQRELTALIGEKETLSLHVRPEQETLSKFFTTLENLPGIFKASRNDGKIVINVEHAESSIAAVISVANQFKVKVTSVDIQEPNLESVFLHLTGRALRD